MSISVIVVFLGLLIFSSHFFNAIFSKIRVPNVLLLLIIGIIAGPVTHWVTPSFFGEFGKVFTTITLIVILFESGTSLKFSDIGKAIGSASLITIVNFIISVFIGALLTRFALAMDWLSSFFVGAIIGGTSSAVVIPMVRQLKMGEKSQTILYLESALSDVLCLIAGLAILEGMRYGNLAVGQVLLKMLKAFSLAVLIGFAGGLVWSALLKLVRELKNSMFTTFAFVFILYGVAELLGLNGGIAALAFGIMLGNSEIINTNKFFNKIFAVKTTSLAEHEKAFFSEIVFIFQTYFFVYVGIHIQFGSIWTYVVGIIIVSLIILARPLSIRLLGRKNISIRDTAIMSIMTPKGLVLAVLASLPLQMGFEYGEKIQDLGYSIVLSSIIICSALVIILNKDPLFFFKIIKKKEGNSNEQSLPVDETLL